MVRSPIKDSNYEQFIRLCLCSQWSPAALSRAAGMCAEAGFDWSSIVSVAEQEFVSPLMYHCLHNTIDVPPEFLQRLHKSYLWWARRSMLCFHELPKVLLAYAESNIPVILLKGAALADALYGNIALRPLRDIDLLIPPQEVRHALRILEEQGYMVGDIEVHESSTFEYENELLLVKHGATEFFLELHWSLLDSIHHQNVLDMDWFWHTAVPAEIAGHEARMLGPEAQILHLCSHLALHHQSVGLLWFNDIAMALQGYGDNLNWDVLLERAKQYDLVRPLQEILSTVVDEWYIDLPEEELARLSALIVSAEEQRVYERHTAADRPVAQRFLTDLTEIPRWSSKIRYGLINLFPKPAYMIHRYNITSLALLPLYYPYRWLLGLSSAAKSTRIRKT